MNNISKTDPGYSPNTSLSGPICLDLNVDNIGCADTINVNAI